MEINKTYAEKIEEVNTEKVLLAHLEPTTRAIIWTLDSGAIYKRTPQFFVIDVKKDTTSLSEASSEALSSGEWFYDAETNFVFIRLSDDSNPKNSFISLTLRLFMSNAPYVQTHDFTDGGIEIEYDARLPTTSPTFPQEIDNADQLGISLESKGSLSLQNTDGFWEPYFDKLFWENKTVKIYSWFPDTRFSEVQKIFEGIITDKKYTETAITFRLKDFIFKLRQPVDLGFFTASDGTLSDDIIGTTKRRLYGQVQGVHVQSIDQILVGFAIAGTITGSSGSAVIAGSGTDFLDELSPGDELTFTVLGTINKILVDSIQSDTSFTASEESSSSFAGLSATNLPNISYRKKNRTLHIAGHKLREPTTTITSVIQPNRIAVGSTADMFANDSITVNGVSNTIKRIIGTNIILLQTLTAPTIGQSVIKNPVTSVSFNKLDFVLFRDYTISNSTEGKLVLNALAEFNTTIRRKIIGTVTFTSSSRGISGAGTKFLSDFRPRDWIISGDIAHQVWYEILQVNDDDDMDIRVAYAGSTTSAGTPGKRNVIYVGDDSEIIVDTLGMENSSGEWVKTASNVVKDLLNNDALITNLDASSFTASDIDAPFIVSLKLPLKKGGPAPKIRDIIKLMNKTVFGSLITKTTFDMAFNVLNAEKPSTLSELGDDDVLGKNASFTVGTRTRIIRRANARYNFFDLDKFTLKSGNSRVETTNTTSFIDNLLGTKNELDVDIYLLNTQDATTIAERYAFFHSLTQQVVRIKSDLRLVLNDINDKMFISFDRLFQRLGGSASRKKIGIISKIKRSGETVEVDFTDLSGIFNRVGTIAPDSANAFTSATDTEKILNGYIVDDSTELPNSSATTDDEWGINLIG